MDFQSTTRDEPSLIDTFLSQPHQPFFFMGIVWSIISMLLFMLVYKGVLSLQIDTITLHAYTMLFIVFTHFFHGFLLTTFPRFCFTQAVPSFIYIRLFLLYLLGSALFFAGAIFFAPVALIGVLTIFAAQLFAVKVFKTIYDVGTSPEKSDPFWLLTAHAGGLAAHLVFVVGIAYDMFGIHFAWQPLGMGIGFYLYFLFLTFVVAQRMVPFFSHVMASKPPRFVAIVYTLLILKTVTLIVGFGWGDVIVTALLSLYLFKEILSWKLPIFDSPAILWVLHLGLFWLPAGLTIDAISRLGEVWLQTSFLFAGLHLLAIGFVTTMLIGFGTRVTLGHSGQVPHADRYSVILFWLTQIVVLTRFVYSMAIGLGLDLQWLFDAAAGLWMVLFIAWGAKFGPTLVWGNKKI
jgi:uncharacterized protein involved in response to NO